ncbi:hypothetical protein [Cerasicoccus fimbriatus]|uniref:hypothetical protein n=1 Tax=Cerasicoccus fimbriatus TaxID=3014554 RepID=UPI0022B39591|nr:hypothetical protein [Cerasicoccus sp. TK19100]
MSLFLATLLTGLVLILWGLPFFKGGTGVRTRAFSLLRSKPAAMVLFGGAALWFLYHVTQLGKADFGDYKMIMLVVFGASALGAFVYTPDFLAVRGLAGLMLLSASPLLGSAYMQYDEPQRLVLVSIVYVLIIAAMFIGTMPYLMRDLFEWLWAKPKRLKLFGGAFMGYGALLVIVSFTY